MKYSGRNATCCFVPGEAGSYLRHHGRRKSLLWKLSKACLEFWKSLALTGWTDSYRRPYLLMPQFLMSLVSLEEVSLTVAASYFSFQRPRWAGVWLRGSSLHVHPRPPSSAAQRSSSGPRRAWISKVQSPKANSICAVWEIVADPFRSLATRMPLG